MPQEADETLSVAGTLPDADAPPTKLSQKSFKKKFAKLKIQFELRMRESESLIREELRIEDLSKRIQEQNDQLLEVLMEFNDSLHVSPKFRFDLSAPGDDTLLPSPESEPSPSYSDPALATSMLKNARHELAAGHVDIASFRRSYRQLENGIKRGNAFPPHLGYTSLTKVPHSAPLAEGQNSFGDPGMEQKLGFLSPEHEGDYFLRLDGNSNDIFAALEMLHAPAKPSLAERERDYALRSPISVHHWLRRNQPSIFLQDNENASEKSSSRPSNLRASKRAPQPSRKDEDTHDEDSVLMESAPTSGGSKGKRKRDEEMTPRPKASSSRSSRKKKDDGSSSAKRPTKRSSGVGA